MEDLVGLFEQIAGSGGGQGDNEPTTTNMKLGERLEAIESKVDDIASMLAQVMGLGGEGSGAPPGEAGSMPPEGELPPELLAALGGGAGAPIVGAEGAPMPPEMAGGMPPPEALPGGMPPGMMPGGAPGMEPPGMPPGGMIAQASYGTTKSALTVSELVARLRKS
jgi:hypothetical protein